ncbi:hypothetical protein ABBQ32_000124 [Trebouxia sp. C0010 RCD-2024]
MALTLQPGCKLHTSCNRGLLQAFQRCSLSQTARRPQNLAVQASGRTCQLTGKKANNGYVVTFSHKRNKKLQHINLQQKKVYWPEGSRWVKLRVCTKALKTIEKKGLDAMAREAGLDLSKLPYTDVSKNRLEYLAQKEPTPAMPRKIAVRRMKNPEKIAASKKKPLVAKYLLGNRVYLTRDE